MKVQVKPLRQRDARISDYEIQLMTVAVGGLAI